MFNQQCSLPCSNKQKKYNQLLLVPPTRTMKDSVKLDFNARSVMLHTAVSVIVEPQQCSQLVGKITTTPQQKKKLAIPSAPRKVKKPIRMNEEITSSVRRRLCFDDFVVDESTVPGFKLRTDEEPVANKITRPFCEI
ncbi:ATAD2 [Acrasis kona]|uniref:ATAD2 n=1 Tax=Acrasis kona TaxID=1008807 RepID=A0AAW2YR43_9EUKA